MTSRLYIPQSDSIHPAVAKNVLSRSGGIALGSVFVSDIAKLQDMKRRKIKAFVKEGIKCLGWDRLR